MLVEILKSKIQGAIITKKELYYQGSIGIDRAILAKSDIAYELIKNDQAQIFKPQVVVLGEKNKIKLHVRMKGREYANL